MEAWGNVPNKAAWISEGLNKGLVMIPARSIKKNNPVRENVYTNDPRFTGTDPNGISRISVPGATKTITIRDGQRTYQDVLSEITTQEKQRDEDLAMCQDAEESTKIRKFYQEEISKLWDEYRELKGE